MIFTDLNELKGVLEINPANHREDLKLNFFAEWVTGIIEEFLNRKISKKSRTEYYDGTNTVKLLLRCRPVFTTPAIEVFYDEGGYYGSVSGSFSTTTQLTYGDNFYLKIDQDDGSSRSGILYRRNNVWPKFIGRQKGYLSPFITEAPGTIKVTYTAGYTLDTLPANFRAATTLLVARLRHLLPLGIELSHESYEERVVGYINQHKNYLFGLIKPLLLPYRNWSL